MKHGKKYEEAKKLVDKSKAYPLTEAIDLLKKVNYAKFDAGIEIAIKTNTMYINNKAFLFISTSFNLLYTTFSISNIPD